MASHSSQVSQRAGPDQTAGVQPLQVGSRVPGPPHPESAVEAAGARDPGPAVRCPEPPGCPAWPHPAGGGWPSTQEVSSEIVLRPWPGLTAGYCQIPTPATDPEPHPGPLPRALVLTWPSFPTRTLRKLVYCQPVQALTLNMSERAEVDPDPSEPDPPWPSCPLCPGALPHSLLGC